MEAPPGGLTLDSIVPGRYLLRINLVGYQHLSDTVAIQAGERLRVRAHMERSRIQLKEAVF